MGYELHMLTAPGTVGMFHWGPRSKLGNVNLKDEARVLP